MKTAIICFSQTGNTRKVAEQIRDGIRYATGRCDLFAMESMDTGALAGYDFVGLGCPAFYCQEPFNVRDFIENLPPQNNRHWFVFCSHGAVMGQVLVRMADGLEKRGARVIGSHHTYADITVPFYPKHTLTSGHPDDRDLQEAFEFGRAIAGRSRAAAAGDTRCMAKPSPAPEAWARKEAEMLTREFLARVMPPLSINTETCVQCGECRDACPVNGIDIDVDPPRIQDPCIYCFRCVCICPTCAIEADWSRLVKMAPGNYARYREALHQAEARGEFRWLVNPDTVDCGNPLYKQREKEAKGH